MAKVERRTIWRRRRSTDFHEAIECAVMSDGSSPATEFWVSLGNGTWREDPEFSPPRDKEQIYDRVQLLARIEHVGEEGCPDTATSVNFLEDGIWEFKFAARRLTYWDTPGDGTFNPKDKIDDRRTIVGPEMSYWWYPRMDPYLRLGCAWAKTAESAPPEGIARAKTIREEDCAHDRQPAGGGELEGGGDGGSR